MRERGASLPCTPMSMDPFSPVVRGDYRVGLPNIGRWREVLNTDADDYGGSGVGNFGGVNAEV